MPLSRKSRAAAPPSRSWLMALPVLVFLATIALTVGAAAVTRDSLDRAAQARVELLAGPLTERVTDRLQSAASVARGTAGLFSAEAVVKPAAFHAYVAAQGMPRWFGECTVSWAPYAARTSAAALLMDGRRDYPKYRFAHEAPRFPVLLVTPVGEERREALGIDLADTPERLEAIEQARDTGELTMVSVPSLDGSERGFELYYPAYGGGRPETMDERRAAFLGVIFVRAPTEALLGTAMQAVAPYFAFRVSEVGAVVQPLGVSPGFEPNVTGHLVARTVTFGGHTLQVELTPLDGRNDASERQAVLAILGVGTLLALSLSGLVFQQQRARRDAELAGLVTADALDEAERRRALLDLVIAQTSDGIIMADASATVRIFNRAAASQHGVTDEDLAAQRWVRPWDVVNVDGTPLEGDQRPIVRAVKGEPVQDARWVVRKPDGEESYISGSASPLRDSEGRGAGGVLVTRDETARMRAEADRDRLIAALEFSNAELDQFASVASHDLKAPLRGIAQLASFLEEDLGDALNADARKHFALLQGRVRRLQALIDGILNYARAGQSTQTLETFDARAAASEAVALVGVPATLKVELPAPGLIVNGDKTLLQQALMNLVSNAVKHGPADGTVTIAAQSQDKWVHFSVKDEGPGIAPEYHQRIWGMFQTLASRDEKESTGIGLAVVRKVVQSQGGRTWLESTPGHGATFHFTWPRRLRK